MGYVAFICLLFTCFSRPERLNISKHRMLSYLVLVFTIAHVGVLLIFDPTLIEYLKPNAPPYMWLGTFAAIFIAFVIISSSSQFKKSFFNSTTAFKRVHKIASWLIIIGCLFHIIDSGFYIFQLWQIIGLIFIALFSLYSLRVKRIAPVNLIYLTGSVVLFLALFLILWGWRA